MKRWLAILCALVWVVRPTAAHWASPGYLQLKQSAPDTFSVLWKVPMRGDRRLKLDPAFPDGCVGKTPVASYRTSSALIQRWSIVCNEGLTGKAILIAGLQNTLTDVLVRLNRLDGSSQTVRLKANDPSFVVAAAPNWLEISSTYLWLGVEHILLGIDHLLFVLGLLIIVSGWRRLVATITAFTLAHSMTLAAATLGYVHVARQPVEAVIALSILFLATAIVHARRGGPGLAERWPWLIAFVFGLLHGFGFAGALSEVGLPEQAIPLALLFFNVGVELGQLAFIAGVLALGWAARRLQVFTLARWQMVATYGIGSMAAFWFIERVSGF